MKTDGYTGGYRPLERENRPQRGAYTRPPQGERSRAAPREEYARTQSREEPDSEVYLELKSQLTEYYRKGVKVSLGGVRMPVSRIARICAVKDEGKYMGDFIIDESGELTEVRFDRVSR